jgi:thioesterase domain-containing protein
VRLARELPGWSLVGLQACGLAAGSTVAASVPEMARAYAAAIVDRQPCGPYHLLGWSFGGVVAHEVARELERGGGEVALVVTLDSDPLPAAMPPVSAATRLAGVFAAAGLPGADFAGLTPTEAARALAQRLGPAIDPTAIERLLAVWENNAELHDRFIPGRMSAPLVQILAMRDRLTPPSDTAVWRAFCDSALACHELDCEHEEMLGADAVRLLAPLLRDVLETTGGDVRPTNKRESDEQPIR